MMVDEVIGDDPGIVDRLAGAMRHGQPELPEYPQQKRRL
jgi:hypothetical protein